MLTPATVVIKDSTHAVDETANYNITTATISTGVIQQRPITVTAAANTKQYDGTTSAAATPTGSALQNGDGVTSGETYDNGNVGTTHVLTPATVVIKNSAQTVDETANYNISTATISTGVINPLALTIGAPTIASKLYDGTATAGAVTVGTLSGLMLGQTVTATATAADYSSANVGSYTGDVVTYTLHDGQEADWRRITASRMGRQPGRSQRRAPLRALPRPGLPHFRATVSRSRRRLAPDAQYRRARCSSRAMGVISAARSRWTAPAMPRHGCDRHKPGPRRLRHHGGLCEHGRQFQGQHRHVKPEPGCEPGAHGE